MKPIRRDWAASIFQVAQEFMDGELCVIKPGTPGTYDPVTDGYTGGTPDQVIIDWRAARAQHIRMPLETNDGNGWTTRRRFRFQMELRENDPAITQGLVVRYRGGKDPVLATLSYQVISAVNSSHAPLRTIETMTEQKPVTEDAP